MTINEMVRHLKEGSDKAQWAVGQLLADIIRDNFGNDISVVNGCDDGAGFVNVTFRNGDELAIDIYYRRKK